MRILYTIILFNFLSGIYNFNFAQKRIDYKDVYEIVKTGQKENAYTILLSFQKQNPEFANAYFQLGLISQEWAYDFNPFTEFDLMKLFIYNTKLYFNLAQFKIADEKKRNREYYVNAIETEDVKDLSFEEISAFIDKQTKEIREYEENIVDIINFFNRSSDHYNECVTIFMKINSEYAKIKHIYLTEDDSFNADLKKLELHFDSTIYYFEKYKSSLEKYPIEGYKQTYTLKDIQTYRLDGLTYSNFMNNRFTLWNYKKWANDVRTVKKEYVSSNRNDLIETDQTMKELINTIESGGHIQKYVPYNADKRLIYKIEKFDNNSSAVHLLKLNASYINYLKYYKLSLNDPLNDSSYSFNEFLQYVNDYVYMKFECDSLNEMFMQNINDQQVNKYAEFYSKQYKGKDGLISYSNKLNNKFKEKLKSVQNNLKLKFIQEQFYNTGKQLKYKKINANINYEFPKKESVNTNQYIAYQLKKGGTFNIYAGIRKMNSGFFSGFAGQTIDNEQFVSFVNTDVSDTSDVYFSVIEPTDDGFFAIQSNVTQSAVMNTLKQYSSSGKEILKKKLPYTDFPVYMGYDDINQIVYIIFSGIKPETSIRDNNTQTILFLNLNENEVSQVVKLKGNLAVFDIIKSNNSYLVFNNFTSYMNTEGSQVLSSAGKGENQTNILITTINNDGLITKHTPILKEEAFFGIDAVKLNSDLFNILGFRSDFGTKRFQELKDKDFLFLMLNSNMDSIYSAWHD